MRPRTTIVHIAGMAPDARSLRLVLIPRGMYLIGAEERGSNRDESPVHPVRFRKDFYISDAPVTQAQWSAVMGSLPTPAPSTSVGRSSIGLGQDHPVDSATWNEIVGRDGFLASLGAATDLPFRLPTEAEWEVACRGKTRTRFSFGDSLDGDDLCENASAGLMAGRRSEYMWFCGSTSDAAGSGSQPVAMLLPNAFGLYDCHGNIFEWCSDWYSPSFYGLPEALLDDPANDVDVNGRRVIRGGCWAYGAQYARSALRYGQFPDRPDWAVGFRVALAQ